MSQLMIDAIGEASGNIPVTAPKVAGYATGSGVVPWTPTDWARFPHSGHVRIDQSPGEIDPLGSDVLDVENGAAPEHVSPWVAARMKDGIEHSDLYGTPTSLSGALADLRANGPKGWDQDNRVRVWVANWNLNVTEASALTGTLFLGALLIVAVQWASPSSNPNTPVPGDPGSRTLHDLNVDLNETLDSWKSAPGPAPVKWTGYVVPTKPLHGPREVHSTDQGKTWT